MPKFVVTIDVVVEALTGNEARCIGWDLVHHETPVVCRATAEGSVVDYISVHVEEV